MESGGGVGKVLFLMEEDDRREDSDRPLTLGWLLPVSPFPPPGAWPFCHFRGRAGPDP